MSNHGVTITVIRQTSPDDYRNRTLEQEHSQTFHFDTEEQAKLFFEHAVLGLEAEESRAAI